MRVRAPDGEAPDDEPGVGVSAVTDAVRVHERTGRAGGLGHAEIPAEDDGCEGGARTHEGVGGAVRE